MIYIPVLFQPLKVFLPITITFAHSSETYLKFSENYSKLIINFIVSKT